MSGAAKAWSPFVGLTSLAILVQAVLAGIFLKGYAPPAHEHVVDAHNVVGMIAALFSLVTMVLAVVGLKDQKDLLFGSIGLFALMIIEVGLGTVIHKHPDDGLTAVHVPLAVLLLALTVFLSTRAAALKRAS